MRWERPTSRSGSSETRSGPAREGLTRYEWVQNSFSLLDRDDAETVLPFCREHDLGYEAFGPLAGMAGKNTAAALRTPKVHG